MFLTSLVLFYDIGAILIIAFFCTGKILFTTLLMATIFVVIRVVFNKMRVVQKNLYILVGVLLWIAMLKSCVHATLAGVILALFVLIRCAVINS